MVLRCHFGSSYSCLSFPPTLFQCFDPPKRRRETDSECLHHTVGIALLVQHTLCDPLAPTVKNIPDGWEGGMTKNGSLCIVEVRKSNKSITKFLFLQRISWLFWSSLQSCGFDSLRIGNSLGSLVSSLATVLLGQQLL